MGHGELFGSHHEGREAMMTQQVQNRSHETLKPDDIVGLVDWCSETQTHGVAPLDNKLPAYGRVCGGYIHQGEIGWIEVLDQ